MELGTTAHAALVTAAQTGQVIIGAYATRADIDELVREGLGYYLTGSDNSSDIIGFVINDAGRQCARDLTR